MIETATLSNLTARLRFKQFLLLVELAETGRIMTAAERLNMTQPAATRLLQEVEDAFGMALFKRSRRGVEPTAAGRVAIARARILLQDLGAAHEELLALSDQTEGRVVVGSLGFATPVLIPRTVMALKAAYPRILVSVQEGTSDTLLPGLARGEIDVVVGRMTESVPDRFEYQMLYYEPAQVVCGRNHELARCETLTIADLASYDWILPNRKHPFRRQLEAAFTLAGLPRPKAYLESESLFTNAALLQTTDALTLLPVTVARHLAVGGTISLLSIEFGAADAPIGAFLRAGIEPTPPLARFLEVVRATASEMRTSFAATKAV